MSATSRSLTLELPEKIRRLIDVANGVLHPPPGRGRILLAYAYGLLCHTVFAAAVLAMIAAMFFEMNQSLGEVPGPWFVLSNALLILQFPLGHSLLLTSSGRRLLGALAPRPYRVTVVPKHCNVGEQAAPRVIFIVFLDQHLFKIVSQPLHWIDYFTQQLRSPWRNNCIYIVINAGCQQNVLAWKTAIDSGSYQIQSYFNPADGGADSLQKNLASEFQHIVIRNLLRPCQT